MKRIVKAALVLIGGLLGYALVRWIIDLTEYRVHLTPLRKEYIAISGALTFAGLTFFTSNGIVSKVAAKLRKYQEALHRLSPKELLMGSAGVVIGLIIANLLNITILKIQYIGILLALICNFLFAYMGLTFFVRKKELLDEFPINSDYRKQPQCKVLDTSAIIDGRIVDVHKAGFIEGTFIIPEFILKELRHIADSHEPEKRTRGRRGLDILNIIQKELDVRVDVLENPGKVDKNEEVDVKLLKVAKELGAQIVTTDYNLNRIADFQGIRVLNINELAKAIKPVALPGEDMIIKVVKDGKESGQGVGYLDDGTMVVVDEGRKHKGNTIGVEVTHVLQTSTGRMIFAKPKYQIENVV